MYNKLSIFMYVCRVGSLKLVFEADLTFIITFNELSEDFSYLMRIISQYMVFASQHMT